MKIVFWSLFSVLLLAGCKTDNKSGSASENPANTTSPSTEKWTTNNKADRLINETIKAHGGKRYDTADYSFVFRNKKYRFTNDKGTYAYFVEEKTKNNDTIKDVLVNGTFDRYINKDKVNLSKKEVDKYVEALNSVIYFATLPHKLNDAAVRKKYIEETAIKGIPYDVVEVTFVEEGGGKDHDDEFHYWINKNTKNIDYLAYNYRVNNGGVRFRSYYERRMVDGITFQNYINWKAALGTPLKELPSLFEQGKLKELSRIEIEKIVNLKGDKKEKTE